MKNLLLTSIILFLAAACSTTQQIATEPSSKITVSQTMATDSATRNEINEEPTVTDTKSHVPGQVELVTLSTEDDIALAGTLYMEGDTVVILAHQGSYGADQTTWHPFAKILTERGFSVLTFDFRGIGKSVDGQAYWNLNLDIDAALGFLYNRGYDQIICVGASMGGTACVYAALNNDLLGLITLSSAMKAGGGYGDSVILKIMPDDLANLTLPKLFISAEEDETIVVRDTKSMYELSPEPKDILILPGYQHGTELFDTDSGEKLTATIIQFLEDVVDAVLR